jgi:hypothetical protein
MPEAVMAAAGKLYKPKPLTIKSRKELLETIKPHHRRFLREDNGDMPDTSATPPAGHAMLSVISEAASGVA